MYVRTVLLQCARTAIKRSNNSSNYDDDDDDDDNNNNKEKTLQGRKQLIEHWTIPLSEVKNAAFSNLHHISLLSFIHSG